MTDGTGIPATAPQQPAARAPAWSTSCAASAAAKDSSRIHRRLCTVADYAVPGQRARRHRRRAAGLREGAVRRIHRRGLRRLQDQDGNSTRMPMVYVPANDGMLHAFYAGTSNVDPLGGQEGWAFIPSLVLDNLYKLADATTSKQSPVLRRRHAVRRGCVRPAQPRGRRSWSPASMPVARDTTRSTSPIPRRRRACGNSNGIRALGPVPRRSRARSATPPTATSASPSASRSSASSARLGS